MCMHVSFDSIKKRYKAFVHRDPMKVPRKPGRDWYIGIVLVFSISVGVVLGTFGIVLHGEYKLSETQPTPTYVLDEYALNDLARQYKEKEDRFRTLLETGLEADDPAW